MVLEVGDLHLLAGLLRQVLKPRCQVSFDLLLFARVTGDVLADVGLSVVKSSAPMGLLHSTRYRPDCGRSVLQIFGSLFVVLLERLLGHGVYCWSMPRGALRPRHHLLLLVNLGGRLRGGGEWYWGWLGRVGRRLWSLGCLFRSLGVVCSGLLGLLYMILRDDQHFLLSS